MPILVKEIMSKPVQKIDLDATADLAGKLMAKERIDSLIVIREGSPIGILTDSDLIKKIISKNIRPSSMKVAKIMSKPLVTTTPEDSVLEASRKMKRNNIKRIPIVTNGKLVGILSTTDIARTVPEMEDILEYKMKSKETESIIKETTTSGICDSCDNYSTNLKIVNGQWICLVCRDEEER